MQRGIPDIGCAAVDVVLTGTFTDWRELHNLLTSSGVEVPPHGCVALEDRLVFLAHEACHAPTPFAERLQRHLDRMHREVIGQVRGCDPDALAAWCRHGDLRRSEQLGALVWAVATDPRDAVSELTRVLVTRLRLASLRELQAAGP